MDEFSKAGIGREEIASMEEMLRDTMREAGSVDEFIKVVALSTLLMAADNKDLSKELAKRDEALDRLEGEINKRVKDMELKIENVKSVAMERVEEQAGQIEQQMDTISSQSKTIDRLRDEIARQAVSIGGLLCDIDDKATELIHKRWETDQLNNTINFQNNQIEHYRKELAIERNEAWVRI
jgi:chromosome segregation ATPase